MIRSSFGSAPASRQWFAIAGLIAWLGVTALELSSQLTAPSKFGIALCVVLILGPLLIVTMPRLPTYLIAAYAGLVPFDNLLKTDLGGTMTKFVAIAACAALFVALMLSRRLISPSKSFAALVALIVFAGMTVFWAIDTATALTYYGDLLSFVLFYALISLYPMRVRDLWLIVGVAILGALSASFYGVYTFRSEQNLVLRLHLGTGVERIDPNNYAATLLLPIVIVLVLFLGARFRLKKAAYFALLGGLFAGFAVSGSRGAALGFAASAAYLLWRSQSKLQLAAMGMVAIGAIAASPIGQRVLQPDAMSADGRTDIWKIGLASLQQYWLLGAGAGNFRNAFDQYYLATYHVLNEWNRPAHSLFMQSAVEYGIVGFTIVMLLWYFMFQDLREVEHDPQLADIAIALRATIIGLFVVGLSLDMLTYKYTWLAFSLVAMTRSAWIMRRDAQAAAPE